jgi:hypothetical protein
VFVVVEAIRVGDLGRVGEIGGDGDGVVAGDVFGVGGDGGKGFGVGKSG